MLYTAWLFITSLCTGGAGGRGVQVGQACTYEIIQPGEKVTTPEYSHCDRTATICFRLCMAVLFELSKITAGLTALLECFEFVNLP